MHWSAVTRLFGILLMLYSVSFLPSLAVALLYADGQWRVFVMSFLITLVTGAALWFGKREEQAQLSVRDGFLVVALFWVLLGAMGALPFIFGLKASVTDAMFESISGFTTTGATVLVGLDKLPQSILYHRQQIQWLGGMGVIVLAVAILPLLGVGGMQLFRAETSGVSKNEKLTPRIAETARALWLIYFVLTATCMLAYWFAGMSWFDALGHAYSTVATGGFSTHDSSIGHYDSPLIEGICITFMLAGAVNFAVHFAAWKRVSPQTYLLDPEVRAFALIVLLGTLLVAGSLYYTAEYTSGGGALRFAAFEVVSVITSTGFGTAVFANWPLHVPLLLIMLSFTGGCVGSTAGGIKVLRIMLLAKLGLRQLLQLVHPRAVIPVMIGRRPVSDDVMFSLWGFYVLYIFTVMVLTIAMMAAGLDFESAFGAVVATVNLLGPGLGEVSETFTGVNDVIKWLGCFGMLAGRLEIFTLLILFVPAYWRS